MIRPETSNKKLRYENPKKSLPEKLAILLAFVSVFIFFLKILFF